MFTFENAPPIQGQGLEKLAKEYTNIASITERLFRRYDSAFLEHLAYMEVVDDNYKNNQENLQGWFEKIQKQLNENVTGAIYSIALDYKKENEFSAVINKRLHGITKSFVLQASFFNSKDYKQIAQYAQETMGLFGNDSYVQMGEKTQQTKTFKEAFEWMMKEVKKGQHIQRYKGLGEMNPEQLWETTLDANNRRLLQVRIEDAIAADEIFTTLMGDVVEPRRDFIVKNALDVTNLDV